MKWDTRSSRPVLIGGPGWGRLFWGAHTTSEKKRADWNFFWTCAHPHPTCWTALSYKRGEKVTNERSCLPPPPQLYSPSPHWSGWWPLVNLQAWDPSTTTTTRPHLTAAYLSTPWKTSLNWRVSAVTKCTHMHPANTHTHTCRLCSALVCLPYHPHLRSLLVISPVWLMFSCKYRGGKIPLLASTIQTGTSKGDKAALQVSHLFWWWLSSLEISQITHHPHSRWVTYFARPPPWL